MSTDPRPLRVMPGTTAPRNGLPAPGGYQYNGSGEDTLTPPSRGGRRRRSPQVIPPQPQWRGLPSPDPRTPLARRRDELAARGLPGAVPVPEPPACPSCGVPAPDHRAGCGAARMPDPDTERCGACGYVAGSLGHRMSCGDGER